MPLTGERRILTVKRRVVTGNDMPRDYSAARRENQTKSKTIATRATIFATRS